MADYQITTTDGPYCQHKNGWYVRVRFWIFSRLVFVCSDCGEVIYGKESSNG